MRNLYIAQDLESGSIVRLPVRTSEPVIKAAVRAARSFNPGTHFLVKGNGPDHRFVSTGHGRVDPTQGDTSYLRYQRRRAR